MLGSKNDLVIKCEKAGAGAGTQWVRSTTTSKSRGHRTLSKKRNNASRTRHILLIIMTTLIVAVLGLAFAVYAVASASPALLPPSSPPHPPPPPSPPRAAPPHTPVPLRPGGSYVFRVTSLLTISGDLAGFDEAGFKSSYAALAGVSVSDVFLSVASGSVLVTATVDFAAEVTATGLRSLLQAKSAAQLTADLSVTVESIKVASLVAVPMVAASPAAPCCVCPATALSG